MKFSCEEILSTETFLIRRLRAETKDESLKSKRDKQNEHIPLLADVNLEKIFQCRLQFFHCKKESDGCV